jgi:Ni,Fe-hydrogenase III small subunit
VTGPVTRDMREALERTYAATPDPKWVVAAGDCARDGGLFAPSPACLGGVSQVVPVDVRTKTLVDKTATARRDSLILQRRLT